jgi:hypothetical protein
MDRTPYLLPFSREHVPAWRCPTCQVGHLVLRPESLLASQTAQSREGQKHPESEPDWIRYVFACMFDCSHASCKEAVACSGVGSVDHFEYEDDEFGWVQTIEDRFMPQHFTPALTLLDIPDECPASVGIHLEESFALFFSDPGAALNSARAAVEAMLTNLGVKRFVVSKGKRKPLNLHQRIQMLPPKLAGLADLLLAAKWLGNAGSHDGPPPAQADVRIMYDLLEHVLSEIYEGKGKKLQALAKKVNKKKGLPG